MRGEDSLVFDERRDHIAQHGHPMTAIATQLGHKFQTVRHHRGNEAEREINAAGTSGDAGWRGEGGSEGRGKERCGERERDEAGEHGMSIAAVRKMLRHRRCRRASTAQRVR